MPARVAVGALDFEVGAARAERRRPTIAGVLRGSSATMSPSYNPNSLSPTEVRMAGSVDLLSLAIMSLTIVACCGWCAGRETNKLACAREAAATSISTLQNAATRATACTVTELVGALGTTAYLRPLGRGRHGKANNRLILWSTSPP